MKRILLPLAAGAIGLLIVAGNAFAGAERQVTVEPGSDFEFAPDVVTTEIGQAHFIWNWENPPTDAAHNVRQDRRLFYSGPVSNSDTFDVSASAGTYHYYCEPHGSPTSGMEGKVRVRPGANEPDTDSTFRVTWAIAGPGRDSAQAARRWGDPQGPTNTGDRFDVRFKIGDGDWRTWKNDTFKVAARFGRNDSPVHVRTGREYRFKVRSQKGPNDGKVSDWSPKLTVQT